MEEQAVDQKSTFSVEELSQAHGVSSTRTDAHGNEHPLPQRAVVQVLRALGVDASTPERIEVESLALVDDEWRRMLPETLVLVSGHTYNLPVHVHHGETVVAWLDDDTGRHVQDLTQLDVYVTPRTVEGREVGRATFELPVNLRPGLYTIRARSESDQARCLLVVRPSSMPFSRSRGYGFAYLPHSLRSENSWGIGDFQDIADTAVLSALHSKTNFLRIGSVGIGQDSRCPESNRYIDPIYIRIEAIRESGYVTSADRSLIEWSYEPLELEEGAEAPRVIDRTTVWHAKLSALKIIFGVPKQYARQVSFQEFCESGGADLHEFAQWWLTQHPEATLEHSTESYRRVQITARDIEFAKWLQWVASQQLSGAHSEAQQGRSRGLVREMSVGIGVNSFDALALENAVIPHFGVVNWYEQFVSLESAFAPLHPTRHKRRIANHYIRMMKSLEGTCARVIFNHADLIFRQHWAPESGNVDDYVEVATDFDLILGVLAVMSGQTKIEILFDAAGLESWMFEELKSRGFGISVRWDIAGMQPPVHNIAGITDISVGDMYGAPLAGILSGEDIELRERLGVDDEHGYTGAARGIAQQRRDHVVAALAQQGRLSSQLTERELIEAIYASCAQSDAPSVSISLTDAVGERRAMSVSQADDQYPQYNLLVNDSSGSPITVENLFDSARARQLLSHIAALRESRGYNKREAAISF
ncbi:4-alpha-glucanotransferase [Timonella sp. A28]|uniref:4-alpha-glucanotransferase n=1 Tax=Timonella sp. A28 TaxID=3442640 RepID=UPI003EB88CE0